MSSSQDPIVIAKQAEQDLNSQAAKQGNRQGASDSTLESGVDESVIHKFPGAEVKVGSEATPGRGEIPLDEGGDLNPTTGKLYKAEDFEGVGGPEDKARIYAERYGGNNDVTDNVRQGAETRRPPGQTSNNAAGGMGKSTQ